MRVACWITKAKNTYSECVIIIILRRKNSYVNARLFLRYTYIAYIVYL